MFTNVLLTINGQAYVKDSPNFDSVILIMFLLKLISISCKDFRGELQLSGLIGMPQL